MSCKLTHTLTSKISLLLLILISTGMTYAQDERSHWYFGMLAGMKYNGSGSYISLSDNTIERRIVFGQIEGTDNIICASDEDGNLLFYSEGRIFKNRNHENMLNSPTSEYALMYSQAALARDPSNPDKYYVFVTIVDGIKTRLSYTIVDMTLDNGLGGLDPNNTNKILTTDVGEHMVTVPHANGKDTWLVCLRKGIYRAYLITANGISKTPVFSQEGVSFVQGKVLNFGVMQASPDNKLIAVGFPSSKKLFLLEFDNLTGKLDMIFEEQADSDPSLGRPYTSVEFSANSKVLYTTNMTFGIQQYDISNLDSIPPHIDITTLADSYPYLKRGPDGKIFSIQRGKNFIGAIQNPNLIGDACNYNPNVLSLDGTNLLDLPTFLPPKYPEGISSINICEGEAMELFYKAPYGGGIYEWDLGDGTTASGSKVFHTFDSPGTYTVSVEVSGNFSNEVVYSDTKEITIYASPQIQEQKDLYLCSNESSFFFSTNNDTVLNGLDSNQFSVTYYFSELDAQLKDNEVIEYLPEIGTKTIWVRVENKANFGCYDITSFNITMPEIINIDIPTEQYLCDIRSGLTLNAPDGFMQYEWSTGETSQSITVLNKGKYTLTVLKDFGNFICEAQTTIDVKSGDKLPEIEEINVIDWSRYHNSIEVKLVERGDYEYSLDGINYQSSPLFLDVPLDDYRVYVRDSNCFDETISDELFLLYYDRYFSPNGDGVNDTWEIINSIKEENIEISIFNRYGKILYKMKYNDRVGWDGSFNGNQMPTSDYWFKVVRQNGEVHLGHFTLKR